jgi:hypothetical protein
MAVVRVPTPCCRAAGETVFDTNPEGDPMAYSSILGGDMAPQEPDGREAELLGPSDISDTGSDTIGTVEAAADSVDSGRTGDRGAVAGAEAEIGGDIKPDRIVNLADDEGFPEADPDGMEMTDLDNDDAQAMADEDSARNGDR